MLDIPRPLERVRAWWWDVPAEYRASDAREEPHRMRVLHRSEGALEVETSWRIGRGVVLRAPEALRMSGDGLGWSADITLAGVRIHDEFALSRTSSGTRVAIVSTITPATWWARRLSRWWIRRVEGYMTRVWRDAALVCERSGEPGASAQSAAP